MGAALKFVELFAGIGGFRRGLEALGHQCVGWVEWDKYARKSYEAIWPEARGEWNAGDITAVTDDAIRELSRSVGGVDLLAFGFPCQAFSVAGKRGGFEDTRGTLFFEAARFASILRPKYLLAENVVGLLNHDRGATFHTILRAMDELGCDAEWQVLNAKDFGIPQNRERVFIVGHLRGHGGRKVFPLAEDDRQTASELECVGMLEIKGQDAIRRVYAPTGSAPTLTTMAGGNREPKILSVGHVSDSENQNTVVYDSDGMSPTLRNQHGYGVPKIIQKNQRNEVVTKDIAGTIHQSMSSKQAPKILQRGRGYNEGGLYDIVPTVSSHSYQDNNMVYSAVLTPDREEKRQNGRRIKEPDEPMFTLTAQDKHGVMVIQKTHGATTTVNYDQTGTLQAARLDKVPCVQVVGNTNPSGHGMNGNVFDSEGLAPTLTTNKGEGNRILTDARIRKLTPLECLRLMGREDWEYERIKAAGISDSQIYKQAGNGLVPQIVTAIARGFE